MTTLYLEITEVLKLAKTALELFSIKEVLLSGMI